MIIQVKAIGSTSTTRNHYNAPNDIRVGDRVEVPNDLGRTWVAEVTAIGVRAASLLAQTHYAGPIKSIIGRAPLKIELEAQNTAEMRRKLQDALDDIEGEDDAVWFRERGHGSI